MKEQKEQSSGSIIHVSGEGARMLNIVVGRSAMSKGRQQMRNLKTMSVRSPSV